MTPQWAMNPPPSVHPVSGSACVEAVGMASAVLGSGIILLTGGCGRGGRDTAARVLIKEQAGWTCASVDPQGDTGDLFCDHQYLSFKFCKYNVH